MITSTPSPLFIRLEATPDSSPLCQKPPSPITATGRLTDIEVEDPAWTAALPDAEALVLEAADATLAAPRAALGALDAGGNISLQFTP